MSCVSDFYGDDSYNVAALYGGRRLIKGSAEAKAYMARLRAMRGKKRKTTKGGRALLMSRDAIKDYIARIDRKYPGNDAKTKMKRLRKYPYNYPEPATTHYNQRVARLPKYAKKWLEQHHQLDEALKDTRRMKNKIKEIRALLKGVRVVAK